MQERERGRKEASKNGINTFTSRSSGGLRGCLRELRAAVWEVSGRIVLNIGSSWRGLESPGRQLESIVEAFGGVLQDFRGILGAVGGVLAIKKIPT